MTGSETTFTRATRLAEAGRHSDVVACLASHTSDLDGSPGLALLLGSAEARRGRTAAGIQWIEKALRHARAQGDAPVERRALNARGSIALVTGRVDEAADYYTQGLLAASRDQDLPALGRCANNIGIVNDLRGRHAEAISAYTMALSAYQRAGLPRGVAESYHNLAITYREQGDLDQAAATADRSLSEAETIGDDRLIGLALRGRAEIRLSGGTALEVARQEVGRAMGIHTTLGDDVEVAEDLRVIAVLHHAHGNHRYAEPILCDVISRARALDRAQLAAEATRDYAFLLDDLGRTREAHANARSAMAIFTRMGADHELRKLATRNWDTDLSAELGAALEPLHEAQILADTGQYRELIAYLEQRPSAEIERSPTLALLRGIGCARLGQPHLAQQWTVLALTRARAVGDRAAEVRALNVCGVVALERGGMAEAIHFFTRAQEESLRAGDLATVGRSANNLGIVANMQGEHERAAGAYATAIAAYQRAHHPRGVAETEHNLGITRREQGLYQQALDAANAAVRDAEAVGDPALKAQALAGRAEIRIAAGEPRLALREVERAIEMHRTVGDPVREAEDLRILGLAHAATGNHTDAESCLRQAAERGAAQERPLLAAAAHRDLARLLAERGETVAARQAAADARTHFARLNAAGEVARLDEFLAGW